MKIFNILRIIYNFLIRISKAIVGSLCWNFLSIIAGGLQILIIIVLTPFLGNQISMEDIIKNGILLFLCSAFVSASVIDFLFTKKQYERTEKTLLLKVFKGFVYVIPLIVIVFIAIIYSGLLLADEQQINTVMVLNFTFFCCMVSIGHSFIYRTFSIYFRR